MPVFTKLISAPALALCLSACAAMPGTETLDEQAATPATAPQETIDTSAIATTEVAPGLYMLEGRGGNIGLLTGPDGAFVIDSQYADLAPANLAKINELADGAPRFLLNTHWHGDHTGGNEAFSGVGATVIGHVHVRDRLTKPFSRTRNGETQTQPPAPAEALPVITFDKSMSLHVNGQTIDLIHFPHAHTDGDSAVYFREANVLHMGDVMFSGRFPFIDLQSGGSVPGYISALDKAHALANDQTIVLPGHGPVSTRADIAKLSNVLKAARAAVRAQIGAGKTLDQILAAKPLAEWDAWSWQFINADTMVRTIHADLTGEPS